jgi:hypothetical protein
MKQQLVAEGERVHPVKSAGCTHILLLPAFVRFCRAKRAARKKEVFLRFVRCYETTQAAIGHIKNGHAEPVWPPGNAHVSQEETGVPPGHPGPDTERYCAVYLLWPMPEKVPDCGNCRHKTRKEVADRQHEVLLLSAVCRSVSC